ADVMSSFLVQVREIQHEPRSLKERQNCFHQNGARFHSCRYHQKGLRLNVVCIALGNNGIGTLKEKSLHADIKKWYAQPGDQFEVPVDGFIIDIVRDNLLIEIQTSNFSSVKEKLRALVSKRHVRLVHPISTENWIVRESLNGNSIIGRRRSPKRMSVYDMFDELVSIPDLMRNQNFELEILLIKSEETRRRDGKGTWRRGGWSIYDKKLLEVESTKLFRSNSEFASLVPEELERPFTTTDLSFALGISKRIARKMAYSLRKSGTLVQVGRRGNAILYE
ncbi:MAG: hypothetical protein JSW61_08090, partial [Candidatus Thorarchaeota archaeon]